MSLESIIIKNNINFIFFMKRENQERGEDAVEPELSEEQRAIVADSIKRAHDSVAESLHVSAEATNKELEVLRTFLEEEGQGGDLKETREYFGLSDNLSHSREDVYNAIKKLREEIDSRGEK